MPKKHYLKHVKAGIGPVSIQNFSQRKDEMKQVVISFVIPEKNKFRQYGPFLKRYIPLLNSGSE